jgi:hypothetical protein
MNEPIDNGAKLIALSNIMSALITSQTPRLRPPYYDIQRIMEISEQFLGEAIASVEKDTEWREKYENRI